MTAAVDTRSETGQRPRGVVLAGVAYHHRFDGAARSFLNLLVRLPEAGYRPVVAFVGEGACSEAYRAAGLDVRILDACDGFDQFNKAWLETRGLWRFRALGTGLPHLARQVSQLIREERVSIAHFNEARALLSLGWAPRLMGVPSVLHVRGSLRPLPRALRFTVQAVPSRLILVGKALETEIASPFRGKSTVIYNSVSVPPSTLCGVDADDGARPLRVLTLAAFEPFKGYHHLLDAAGKVASALAPRRVVFRWFGNTVDDDYVALLRTRMGSVAQVGIEMHDWIPDVSDELRRADLVVLPTVEDEVLQIRGRDVRIQSSEGVPRCLIEAAAFGRAVVSTRVGGIGEAVQDGVGGVLVPPSDPAALADAIATLLKDPHRRRAMGQAGRAYVSATFSHEALVGAVAANYATLRNQAQDVAA